MRIWSIHPKHLDSKGLVALWRETLLAKHVLEGKSKGYKNHSQLIRFKKAESPLDSINQYLAEVYKESKNRNYNFDSSKIDWNYKPSSIAVTTNQITFEIEHLLKKLTIRDIKKYNELQKISTFEQHPLFTITQGNIENWEKI